MYNTGVSNTKEVQSVADKSRAEYYRKRRETRRQFMVLMDKDELERFDSKLKEMGKSRAEWLREKVREVLGEE